MTKEKITVLSPSNLENIDGAMHEWVDQQISAFATTNRGWKKVPVIWVSAERAYQAKRDKGLRDKEGALIYPIITVERISMEKDPSFKGSLQANIFPINDYRGGSIPLATTINQSKTQNFQNADSKRETGQLNFKVKKKDNKIVYTHKSIPIPTYISIMYRISLRAEYQQQINEMNEPFIVSTGNISSFIMKKEGHRYEGFFQPSYEQNNNAGSLDEEERIYQTSFDVKVLGYLIGSKDNQEQPQIVERENAVKLKTPRERVIVGEDPEHPDNWGKYRE